MTPLPWDRRDRRANTQKVIFEYGFVNFTHFSVKDIQISIKLPMWPKGCPKRAKEGPRAGQRGPKAPKGRPERTQGLPKESKWKPKSAQGAPKAFQRHPKEAKGSQREGYIYIYIYIYIYHKTHDQPPKRTLCYPAHMAKVAYNELQHVSISHIQLRWLN